MSALFNRKKRGKGRTAEQGTKNLLGHVRNPRRLLALVQNGEAQVITIKGYAAGVERIAQTYANRGYYVEVEVLEWDDEPDVARDAR